MLGLACCLAGRPAAAGPAAPADPARAASAPAPVPAVDPGGASRRALFERMQAERARTQAELDRLRRPAVLPPVAVPPAAPPALPAPPSPVTTCDGAGCWDAAGRRYNQGAGSTFFRSDGRVCQQIGATMQCP